MSNPLTPKLIPFLLCLFLAWGTFPVRAATIMVTTTGDSGVGSLREAVTNAQAGDTIDFDSSISITLTDNLPPISVTNLTINGNGATINGSTDIRIFTVDSGASITINDLTM